MNLVDATVVEVLEPPHLVRPEGWSKEGWKVVYVQDCYGNRKVKEDFFATKDEADRIQVGYKYLT